MFGGSQNENRRYHKDRQGRDNGRYQESFGIHYHFP
jgi:hypothetical protein